MNKNKLTWFWYFVAVVALCLIGIILYPAIVFSDAFRNGCIYIVVDGFILLVSYGILRKFSILTSWKFVAYLAIIVAGSLAVNFLVPAVKSERILPLAFAIFPLFAFLNFVLSKIAFGISVRAACLTGMLMGLINTLVCIVATPVYFVGH